jgi:hypothetical protein
MAYLGGSAYAMAKDVGEGYVLLSAVLLKRMNSDELKQLRFEIEKILTTIRSEQYPFDDNNAIQTRNRKLSRLNSAVSMINGYLMSRH